MNRIGERMREYRRSIKMTQADFASRLGVSTDALLGRQSADRVVVDVTSLTPRQRSLVQDMVEEFAAGNRRGDAL